MFTSQMCCADINICLYLMENEKIFHCRVLSQLDIRQLGGGGYSYICVRLDKFILKAIVFTVCEHEYTLPPNYLV